MQVFDEYSSILNEALETFKPQFIEGMDEYSLIKSLKLPPFELFDDQALRDPLTLFQTHFILFHHLYQLRAQWRSQGVGELEIALTKITLLPMTSPSQKHSHLFEDTQLSKDTHSDFSEDTQLSEEFSKDTHSVQSQTHSIETKDPLADYYLNWDNLNETSTEDVEDLLTSFWQKMAGFDQSNLLSQTQLNEMLSVLALPPVNDGRKLLGLAELKAQYRKLQHQNHPDKGGCAERSKAILNAYNKLRKHILSAA
ncbi:DNA-J related domain-containing protein [Glaciecola siphonariae]|uniref:DNA-J related domain-containing protein n=1 Tax=Glaciecola siphonariae TaxID=521012 RepID=A0ABV9LR08_9ALTE